MQNSYGLLRQAVPEPVEKWGLFFSYVDNKKYAYYISELVRSEKGIMIAEKIVKRMSEADDNWYVQNSLYKAECDRNSIEYYAEKKGHEEGLQEGLQQGLEQGAQQKTVENARKLLADGKYTAEEISALLQIPVEAFAETVKG